MSEIIKINHVALVVEDVDAALGFWRDSLGLALEKIVQVPKEESVVAFLPLGDSEIELVQPTTTGSGVAKYLQKRGPGMHHLCLEVRDIQSAIDRLAANGVRMIHETPVLADDGRKYAFVHPKAAFGVLLELYELRDVSAGRFPTLTSERLLLREFEMTDAAAVFEMYRREDMCQYVEHDPMQSIEEAEERVRSRMRLFRKGWGCRWAITLRDSTDEVIGSCGYFNVRVGTHTVEIGFEVHPAYWRRGFMTEALTAVVNYSFGDRSFKPVNRMEALVHPDNERSVGLLTGLGFVKEGTRRKFCYWGGEYHDLSLLALLKEDWKR